MTMQLTDEQFGRIQVAFDRVQMARRELDSLIGDHYLSPRVSIVGVHFTPLAAAVEKLRWAETEWRELQTEFQSGKKE